MTIKLIHLVNTLHHMCLCLCMFICIYSDCVYVVYVCFFMPAVYAYDTYVTMIITVGVVYIVPYKQLTFYQNYLPHNICTHVTLYG